MADNAIDIYVEVGGQERYHSSLRGRDEDDQHPISAITNLQTTLDGIDTKITTTKAELQTTITNVRTELQGSITNVANSVTILDNKVDTKVAELKTLIDNSTEATNAKIATLTTRVDNVETSLSTNITRIDAQLLTLDQEIADAVTEFHTKTTELDAKIATNTDAISTLNTQVTTLNTNVTNLTAEVDELDEAVDEVDKKYEGALIYRGSVARFEFLPTTGNQKGDLYNVEKNGANYHWTGLAWDKLSEDIDLSQYTTKVYVDTAIDTTIKNFDAKLDNDYYNRTEIDDLIKDNMNFRGVLPHISDLDSITPKAGYFYKVTENNQSYIGTGTAWIEICGAAETYTREQVDALLALKADKTDLDDVVRYTDLDTNRKTIKLDNNNTVSGLSTDANITNLITIDDSNLVQVGDATATTNVNTKDKVTVNNTNIVITDDNLNDFLVAGDGISIEKTTITDTATGLTYNASKISVNEDAIEPIVKPIVEAEIQDVKDDVAENKQAIEEIKEDLKWRTL